MTEVSDKVWGVERVVAEEAVTRARCAGELDPVAAVNTPSLEHVELCACGGNGHPAIPEDHEAVLGTGDGDVDALGVVHKSPVQV